MIFVATRAASHFTAATFVIPTRAGAHGERQRAQLQRDARCRYSISQPPRFQDIVVGPGLRRDDGISVVSTGAAPTILVTDGKRRAQAGAGS